MARWWLLVVAISTAAVATVVVAIDLSRSSPRRSAVTAPTTTPAVTRPATTTTAVTPAVTAPPALLWSPCHGHECAMLDVPLDYTRPGGPHINIALERRPATDRSDRIGSLLLNPGGPGESGILNFSKDLSLLPAGVLARFDVVAFDPRGIGKSSPVHCSGDTSTGPVDPVPETAAARQALLTADRAYAASCLNTTGPLLLRHVGSVDVARDMEAMRQALGDRGLSYLGLSYGTLLGATYAGLFPTHIRAMVLDGPLDPALPTEDLADAQAVGFESSLHAFFNWCSTAPSCAWHPGNDPSRAFRGLAQDVRDHPLPVGNATLGPQEFYTGTFGSLYAQSFWPSLGRALAGVAAGQGAAMLGLYNAYQRTGDPSFNGDANNAITCIDHPVPRDPGAYPDRAAAAAALAPDFGPLFAWGGLACAVWPVPDSSLRPVGPVHAPGSPPILVVGTTKDPATPYPWARALASELSRGVLLTRVGQDHVAIFYSACVRSWDETYLVTLHTPPLGTVCSS